MAPLIACAPFFSFLLFSAVCVAAAAKARQPAFLLQLFFLLRGWSLAHKKTHFNGSFQAAILSRLRESLDLPACEGLHLGPMVVLPAAFLVAGVLIRGRPGHSAAAAASLGAQPHSAPTCPLQPPAGGLAAIRAPREVRFVPCFRAAYEIDGVVVPRTGEAGYNVTGSASGRDIAALLHGLSKSGQLEAADRTLRAHLELRSGRAAGAQTADEAGRLVQIVLNSLADRGRMQQCAGLLAWMQARGMPLGQVTYCTLIKGHGRSGDWRRVKQIYVAMRRAGVQPDLATCNAAIDAFTRSGRMTNAELVVRDMVTERVVSPSARTYNTLLRGYATRRGTPRQRARSLRRAFGVLRRMRSRLGPAGPAALEGEDVVL